MKGEPHREISVEIGGGELAAPEMPVCPACGARARRPDARFCATCGRRLDEDSYFPTDALLASYHQQQRRPAPHKPIAAKMMEARGAVHEQRRTRMRAGSRPIMLFQKNNNSAATTAMAFVVYALVPYLGILFCPGALVMGGIGLLRARRAPHLGGGAASVASILLALVLVCAHLLLWWILYKVPEWSRAVGY